MSLLTVRAASERLGVAYSTLKHWIRDGEVRTTQTPGGHHRISDAELERLLARHEPAIGAQKTRKRPATTGALVVISGRNRLRGVVDEVRVHGLMAQVRLRIGDQFLTAVITRDAVDELRLRRGDDAVAIVKSTEVMIALEAKPSSRS